ncbi:hypothetical protein VNI00_004119 [Paramarasmius palmivorus]|uniref:Uncharacterized protein n=1 Tax=Paramarasmius palmivorus TaxID=297713 RepID=A0AAW0DPU5_9AGAR
MAIAPVVSVAADGSIVSGPLVASVFQDTLRRLQGAETTIRRYEERMEEKDKIIAQLQDQLQILEAKYEVEEDRLKRNIEFQNRVISSLDFNIEKALESKDAWEHNCNEAKTRADAMESEVIRLSGNLKELEGRFHTSNYRIRTLEENLHAAGCVNTELSESLLRARRGNMARVAPSLIKALILVTRTLWSPTASHSEPDRLVLLQAMYEGLQQVEQVVFFVIRANMISRMISGDFDEENLVRSLGSTRPDIHRTEMHLTSDGNFTFLPGMSATPTAPRALRAETASVGPRGFKRPRVESDMEESEED